MHSFKCMLRPRGLTPLGHSMAPGLQRCPQCCQCSCCCIGWELAWLQRGFAGGREGEEHGRGGEGGQKGGMPHVLSLHVAGCNNAKVVLSHGVCHPAAACPCSCTGGHQRSRLMAQGPLAWPTCMASRGVPHGDVLVRCHAGACEKDPQLARCALPNSPAPCATAHSCSLARRPCTERN